MGIFRSVLWIFTSLALEITDYIYKIIMKFFSLNINQFPFIKSFYIIIISAVGFFMMFRIAAMFVQGIWGENKLDKLDGMELARRIIVALVILSFIPFMMPRLNDFAAESAKTFPKMISIGEILPSDVIIEAGNAEFIGNSSSTGEKATLKTVTEKTINDKSRGEYVYFKKTEGIVLVLVLAGICAYTFLNVAIQVIIRMISLLLKMVLAPYAVSGLVDPDDQGTNTWFKLCFSDYLAIFFQVVTMWIAMLFATKLPADWGGFEKGIAFVGAIFAIINAPSGIAQILGADIGTQAAMQSLQSIQMMTGAISAGAGLAKAGVGMAAGTALTAGKLGKTAGALGIYGIGRKLGARSLNPMNVSGGTGSSGGFAGRSGNGGTDQISETFASGGDTGIDWNAEPSASRSSGSAMASPYINERGSVRYADNRVTDSDSRLGQIGQNSRAGGMAASFASYMYKKSADRLFMSNIQRKHLNDTKSVGSTIKNVGQGVRYFGNAIRNAGRNGGIENGSE